MFFLICSPVCAGEHLFKLEQGWQFVQTNDINLHYSQVKTDQWQPVQPPSLLQTNAQDGIYGWYKIEFDWSNHNQKNLALYIQSIRHGDETWLNGHQIGSVGSILEPWNLNHSNPQNLPRKYAIPEHLLQPFNNTLAIKVNLGLGEVWGAMYPGGVGIGGELIAIGSEDILFPVYTSEVLESAIIDTVLVILGLVDLFIIIFLFRTSLHHFDEFWWLLLSSFFMMMGSLLLDHFYILELEQLQGINLLLVVSLLSAPFTTAMYFWAIHKNLSKKVIYPFMGMWLILVCLIVFPGVAGKVKDYAWLVWELLAALFLLYALFCAIQGVFKSYPSAVIQLIGLVVFIISIRTQWLPDDLWEHRNIIIGTLIFRYAILYSYFRRINYMSQDYKNLSENMLQTIEEHKQDVARDLHDDLGQHLTAAKLRLLMYHQGDKKGSIEFIKKEIDASIQSSREIMQSLHPIILEKYTFSEALHQECDRLSNLYSVFIELQVAKVDLSKSRQKHLLRIFQETVFNAIHHGQSSQIAINIEQAGRRLKIEVDDDGKGLDLNAVKKAQGGFGLISLKERVALLDGDLSFVSNHLGGTRVIIHFPL